MKTRVIRRSLEALGLCVLAAGVGQASTLSYYVDIFGPSPVATTTFINPATSTLAAPNGTFTLTVPQFNPALGTLAQVAVQLDWRFDANFATGNFGPPASYGNGTINATYNITAPGNFQNNPTGTLTGISGTAPTGLNSTPGYTQSGSNSQSSALNLGLYTGTSTYTVAAKLVGFSANADNPSLLYGASGSMGGGILTVSYNYSTPVPEPGTSVMMGGALMGLGMLIYRKRCNN